MNKQKSGGWIGVDLDGTLAEYHGWDGTPQANGGIGEPIEEMRQRVMAWLDAGQEVRIVTARVAQGLTAGSIIMSNHQHHFIQQWCIDNLGRVLPITCQKDMAMIELWDDRAVQVEKNTGVVVGFSVAQETFHE